jgi:hypothetical protein
MVELSLMLVLAHLIMIYCSPLLGSRIRENIKSNQNTLSSSVSAFYTFAIDYKI